MDVGKISGRVLRRIKPTADEEKKTKEFLRELISVAKTIAGLDVALVGSTGKGTWLRGDHDIDLFIMFPKSAPREDLERHGLVYGKRMSRALRGSWQTKYAEHPYVRVTAGGYSIDVVPCYRIALGESIISAVDRSPLHLEYILENIRGKEDETRLLKQFCKGAGIYGSDAKTEGFSGYICELLLIHYGSFEAAVRAAAKWTAPCRIEMTRSSARFHDQPLVIIDPVDPNRNAAAVVTAENFARFVKRCAEFAKRPREEFFFYKTQPLTALQAGALKKRNTRFVAVRMDRSDVIDDTLYPQMRRALKRLVSVLEDEDFRPVRWFEHAGKEIILAIELEVWQLPSVKKMVGPPIYTKTHTEEFLKKYSKNHCYIEGDRFAADAPRAHTDAGKLLKKFFSRPVPRLMEDGVPSYLAKEAKSVRVVEGKGFFGLLKDRKFSETVRRKYFDRL